MNTSENSRLEVSSRPKKHKKTAGFTLNELLIVVLILGLLGAVAVPVFNRVRDAAVDNTKVKNADILNSMVAALHQGGVDTSAYAAASDAITALRAGIDIPPTVPGGTSIQIRLEKDLNPAAYNFTPGTTGLTATPPRFDAILNQRNVRP